ncbi:MAG: hypothetical protein MZV64_62115 [Ignavibacteriales bacterium]|nr:hypothetical protein [Ignavibacteriales bacterium]
MDKNNIPNIIEVNPLPGILPNPVDNSCFPKAARTTWTGLQPDDKQSSICSQQKDIASI